MRHITLLYLMLLSIIGCSLAPEYKRPAMETPAHYKESGNWVLANPHAAALASNEPWWEMYHDPHLNDLERQVIFANQDLKVALARYDQAKAVAGVARSELFPTIDAIVVPTRQHTSKNVANPAPHTPSSDIFVGADLSYEIDVWGQVRNNIQNAQSLALASQADVAAVQLSLQALLANYYFTLRGFDLSQEVLDETVVAYEKALSLNRALYQGGAASVQVLYESQTQLEAAKTLAIDLRLQRAQMEHAIAVLIGKTPAEFSLSPQKEFKQQVVTVKPDLASTLLERRPDIAAAELRVQAANANIGVARAAYFPLFNFVSSIGFESAHVNNLFKSSSLEWSLGPAFGPAGLGTVLSGAPVTQILFDGGKIASLNDNAWASYAETVAEYRQTVLDAYREVEDSLAALHRLGQENTTQTAASVAAYRAMDQALYRYKGGLTTYLDVVVEQNIALENELSAIDIRTRHQVASVQLIKALGGGWTPKAPS